MKKLSERDLDVALRKFVTAADCECRRRSPMPKHTRKKIALSLGLKASIVKANPLGDWVKYFLKDPHATPEWRKNAMSILMRALGEPRYLPKKKK